MSRQGLFHRVISQSGTALNPWGRILSFPVVNFQYLILKFLGFQPNPRRSAEKLASKLNVQFSSTKDLVDKLRKLPAQMLIQFQDKWIEFGVLKLTEPLQFAPCIESPESPEEIFLPDSPINLMNRGELADVSQIIGYNSIESLFMIRELTSEPQLFQKYQKNFNIIQYLSMAFDISKTDPNITDVAQSFVDIYFGGSLPTEKMKYEWALFTSDHQFVYGIDKTIKMQSEIMNQTIYHYKFSYDGNMNMMKKLLLLQDFPGAMHFDGKFKLWFI